MHKSLEVRPLSNHCTLALWFRSFLLACLLMGAAPCHLLAATLNLSADSPTVYPFSIQEHLFVFRDASQALTIEDVSQPERQASFKPAPQGVNLGFTNDTVWVRFELSRAPAAPARWLLETSPSFLDHITLFQHDGEAGFSSVTLGDLHAFSLREIPHHNAVFPLSVGTLPSPYFLRLRSSSAVRLQLALRQPQAFSAHRMRENLQLGMVLGVLVVTFFLTLVFWAWLRKSLHFYYALYLVGLFGFLVFVEGHAAAWWLDGQPYWADYAVGVSVCLYFVTVTLFVSQALRLKRDLRTAWWASVLILLALAGCLATALAGRYPMIAPWVTKAALLPMFGGLLCNIWLLRRGHRTYWIYALSFAVLSLVFGATVFRNIGWLNVWEAPLNLLHGGIALHVLFLNLALANQAGETENNYRREKKKALNMAQVNKDTLQRLVALRAAQLNARNLDLQNEINQRTELQTQMFTALQSESQALAEQRQFISRASHEFRTPLAVIDASAQSLRLSLWADSPPVQPRLERIERATKRLSGLMHRYLSGDAEPAATSSLQPEPIALQPWLKKTVQALAPEAHGRLRLGPALARAPGVEPHIDGQAEGSLAKETSIYVHGDPLLLEIALHNLLRNALKYTPPDTAVSLNWVMVGGDVHLLVTDTGAGIAPQDQASLFNKYYRPPASQHTAGSGLGLFLTQDIARQHGGDVVLVSSSAQGSVFCLQLPARKVDP